MILLPFEWIYSLKFCQMYSHFCWLKTKAILSKILDHENLNLGCVRFHFCSLVSKSAIKSVKTQKMGFLQNTEKVRLKKKFISQILYIFIIFYHKKLKKLAGRTIFGISCDFWRFSDFVRTTLKIFEIQKFFFLKFALILWLIDGWNKNSLSAQL